MSALTKAEIFAADDLPVESVDVPEWGGVVYVRSMTGTERDYWEASALDNNGEAYSQRLRNIRARLVVLCAVDDEGGRIFEDGDAGQLGKKAGKVLDRVWEVAQRLNGLRQEDVEEIIKN